jgi:uncharacterized protein (DUF362 family)
MVKGVSIRFQGYEETIWKLLKAIKFNDEINKHGSIVLKVDLANGNKEKATNVEFVEKIVKYGMQHKNPGTEIFIADGADGYDTMEAFEEQGYKGLAEKYDIGLVDLNKAEVKEIEGYDFLRFDSIQYPNILSDSFVISLPKLRNDEGTKLVGALHNMLGAYPGDYYKGFFTLEKKKIKKWPLKYQIHDILKCKVPDFAILDASDKGMILAGQPLEMDKIGAKVLGHSWKDIDYLNLVDESFSEKEVEEGKDS